MRSLIAALLLAASLAPSEAPVCRIGTWTGTPADLAMIEAVHQAEQARAANTAYPSGAPTLSLWRGLVRCREEAAGNS